MPGYLPQTIVQNVMNGNNVAIMLGDLVIAFAQTVGSQVSFGTEQLYGVGTARPQEVQQLRVSPSFSLDSFSLTAHGMTVLGGGQRLEYILAGKSFEMHVVDGVTNTTLYTFIGAKAQNASMNIPANAPLRSTFAFLALDVIDNLGNSIIDAGDNAIAVAAETVNLVFAAA
jgi:hypothetical protein